MRNFTFVFALLLMTGTSIFAQAPASPATMPTTATPVAKDAEKLPTIKDADKDKLSLLATRRALYESQAKNMQEDFKKAMEDLAQKYQKATDEFNAKADAVFADMKLDRTKYDINLETGQVTLMPEKPVTPATK